MVNDELPYKILTGQIQCKPKCVSISGNTVRFSDGTSVSDVDVIACATGFDINFSFIQDEQINGKYFFLCFSPLRILSVLNINRYIAKGQHGQ